VSLPERAIRVLELRTVRGTGGGPEKTILLGTARTDPARYAITVCYIRDERDPIFHVDERAQALPVDYVEVRERNSFDPRIWPQLKELVRSRNIDIIHSHDYKTDLLAWRLAKQPGVTPLATAHGWTGHSTRERLIYYPGDRWVLARFPHVIAVSSEIRARLVDAGAKPENVTVVLNAIDAVKFHRDRNRESDAKKQFGFAPSDFVIGAVGRLEPQKDFPLLIASIGKILETLPAAHLAIAGDGSLRDSLQAHINGLGLQGRCRLLGHVGDVPLLHHAFDLYVQSSHYEGTPNAVLEAMALESPIVATDAGGTAEVCRHGMEGLIVPIRDEKALTSALLEAVLDTEATVNRVRAARRRVETDLSFDTRLRKVEALYDKLSGRMN
jgi:glycosyltransferase involved in cell wall biosynthesis